MAITGRQNTALLDQMVKDFREIDELERQRQRERIKDLFDRGIQTWFRKTDPSDE